MRENGVVLEHHADIALIGRNGIDQLVTEIKLAALDGVKARDHAKQRGLAAAGRTQQREELPLLDVQRDAFQGNEIPVLFDRVLDDD